MSDWGKDAMKFARTEIPALLSSYSGDPRGFFSELDKAWQKKFPAEKAPKATKQRKSSKAAKGESKGDGEK